MLRLRACLATATLVVAVAWNHAAFASSGRVASELANRDLVVPSKTILLDGGPRWLLPEGQFVYRSQEGDNPAWFNAGATFGLAQDFHLGAVIPMCLAPDGPDLHDPRVHLLYQFTKGTADVGVFAQGNLPFEGDFGGIVGLPVQIHLGSVARFDTGPFLRFGFPEDDAYADFTAPFVLNVNVTSQLFLGPEAAVWTENEFEYTRVPVGFFLGYTIITGGETVGDLSVRVRDHNARSFGDVTDIIFAADLFFDL